jgi:5-methylcytosine-specific restriction endonuclease McrA
MHPTLATPLKQSQALPAGDLRAALVRSVSLRPPPRRARPTRTHVALQVVYSLKISKKFSVDTAIRVPERSATYRGPMAVSRTRRARAQRKRKRRMDRVEHDLTAEQWTALKDEWGGCAYCGATDQPLQKDCVQALSRGGRYTLPNIAPACRSCNASKSNDEVTGWMRRKKLDERSFLVRHYEIGKLLIERFPEEPVAEVPAEPDTITD